MGMVLALVMGVHPAFTIAGLFAMSFIPLPKGVALEGLYRELWTAELLDKFRHTHRWLERVPNQNDYVDNDVIHLVDLGADPGVLINNTAYPIPTISQDDQDIAIKLKRFDTENTRIPDRELYALPYDKEGTVLRKHRMALEQQTAKYGLYSLAPASDTTETPIVETTGSTKANGRKALTEEDLITAQGKLDDLGVPEEGRILVLCNQHKQDILGFSEEFRSQYKNIAQGSVKPNLYGFEIYTDAYNPRYDSSNNKRAFMAASQSSDRDASVMFYQERAFKATGSVQEYIQRAEQDPHNRSTVLGFTLHHIVLPKKDTGFGAIVAAT